MRQLESSYLGSKQLMEMMKNAEGSCCKAGPGFCSLPEGCIVDVIARTSPQDACRLSAVASAFLSATESDALWERFLPHDYREIIARRSSPHPDPLPSPRFSSKKKDLFFALSQSPLLIDGGKKSFWIDKRSGKKCYMLGARELTIIWGDTPHYWEWTSVSESRFTEVACLQAVCWFEIRGKINTRMLSPRTNYAAYLVFQAQNSHGFEDIPIESSFGILGHETPKNIIYLARYDYKSEEEQGGADEYEYLSVEDVRSWVTDNLTQLYSSPGNELLGLEDVKTWMNNNLMELFPTSSSSSQEPQEVPMREDDFSYPKRREDNWFEIEIGEFFIQGEEEMELEMSLMEVKAGHWKNGLVVEGIEIRPKH